MTNQLIFDYKLYVAWCREHGAEAESWALRCNGQPTDGVTVRGKDGQTRFCMPGWCRPAEEPAKEGNDGCC